MKKSIWHLLVAAVALGIMLASSGCAVVDESRMQDADVDRMPWNKQAGWENTTIGMPF